MKSIHACNTGIIFASLWNTVTKIEIGRTNLYFWQRIAHNILHVKPNTSTSISLIQVEMNANPFFEILVQKHIFPAFIHVYPICINFKGPILMAFECIIWWNHELIHSVPPSTQHIKRLFQIRNNSIHSHFEYWSSVKVDIKKSVHTSQRTHYVSIIKINVLILCKKLINFDKGNYIKKVNKPCRPSANFRMLHRWNIPYSYRRVLNGQIHLYSW